MAYARTGPDSDVYCFYDGRCWWLHASGTGDGEVLRTREALRDRLLELRDEGLRVPQDALDRLDWEIEHDQQIWGRNL
jgi:hypothetical protein